MDVSLFRLKRGESQRAIGRYFSSPCRRWWGVLILLSDTLDLPTGSYQVSCSHSAQQQGPNEPGEVPFLKMKQSLAVMSHHQLGLEEGLQRRWGRELYLVRSSGQHGGTGSWAADQACLPCGGEVGWRLGPGPGGGVSVETHPFYFVPPPSPLPGVSSLPLVTAESLSL